MIRINVNREVLINNIERFVVIDKIGIGISNTISISKTIKIIANKKNRIENGIRALWLGSKPHSKGDDFSRFEIDRMAVIQAISNTSDGRAIATVAEVSINVIY
jgi:hypothetical protein